MARYQDIGLARLSLALSGISVMQAALINDFVGPSSPGAEAFGCGSRVFWRAMGLDYDDLASVDDLAALESALGGDEGAVEHLVGSFSAEGVVADDKTTWTVVLEELSSDLEDAITEAISA